MSGFIGSLIRRDATIGDDTYHNIRAYDRRTVTVPEKGMFHKTQTAPFEHRQLLLNTTIPVIQNHN